MEQTLKYVGNSAMLSVSPKSIRRKKIDKTTRLEQVDNDDDADVIIFRIIRPSTMVFPEVKKKLTLSTEIETLLNDPVYPTKEQLKDPRIQYLLGHEDFR